MNHKLCYVFVLAKLRDGIYISLKVHLQAFSADD
jgi:hypothetical protein